MDRPFGENRYDFIDGLRGVAILWVVLCHAIYTFDVRPVFVSLYGFFESQHCPVLMNVVVSSYEYFYRIAFFGNYGVDLFFVISGFLITGLLINFIDGRLDLRRFYVRRIFKIIPHYYALVLLVFLADLIFLKHGLGKTACLYLSNLAFFQNYMPASSFLGHTWSLVIEEQFYIFWAGFLWLMARFVKVQYWRMRWAVLCGVVIIILVNVYRYYFYQTNQIFLRPERFVHPVQMSTLRMDALMAGCLLRLFLPTIDRMMIGKVWLWLIYALGVVAFVLLLSSPVLEFGVLRYWYLWVLPWIGSVFFLWAGLKGCFIFSGNRLLQWVGRSSYGIYLVHYPLLIALSWAVDRLAINRAIMPPVFLAASVLAGWATTRTLEKYFLDLRKRVAP